MRKSNPKPGNFGIGLFFLILVLIILARQPAAAQDTAPTVCRDPRYETVRLEFHNIPQSWQESGWWYLADGASLYGNILVADALTGYEVNESGITAGMAIIGTADYSYELRGDADSPPCDVALSPLQEEGEATPEPGTPAPVIEYQVPVVQQPISQIVVSTGRTCTIQYPKIILVCG